MKLNNNSIEQQAKRQTPTSPLGIEGINRKARSPLPEAHHAFVAAHYLTLTKAEMARKLGCSTTGVQAILNRLNLTVPLNIIAQRRLIGQFTKGQTPINKGKKQTDYMTADAISRTAKTRFKKGQTPHNCYNEVGKVTVRKDSGIAAGYKYICILPGKWELYHRYLWQQTNGAIPQGYCLWFIDGNTMNCDINNLECISRKENRYRNAAHQKLTPKFLARCIVGKTGTTEGLLTETQLLETKKTHILINRKIKQNGKKQNERP